jgi:hypothetical protein
LVKSEQFDFGKSNYDSSGLPGCACRENFRDGKSIFLKDQYQIFFVFQMTNFPLVFLAFLFFAKNDSVRNGKITRRRLFLIL